MTRAVSSTVVAGRLHGSMLLAIGLCAACLDNKLAEPEDAAAPDVCIAEPAAFEAYREWKTTFSRETPDDHGGVIGVTKIYLNNPPPEGATEFPVGTILVKTVKPVDSTLNIHAMVKRGGGFNPKGARGWEFFELALEKSSNKPFILWRGQDPPDGEMYELLLGGANLAPMDAEMDCNSCHGYADTGAKDGTFKDVAALLD